MSLAKKLNINQITVQNGGFAVIDNPKFKEPTKGLRVFVRVDYNVPLDDEKVTDTRRIDSTIPTLQKIISFDPERIIICSHLGRPDGQIKPEFSLKPVVPIVEAALKRKIVFIENWFKPNLEEDLKKLPKGSIILLENVRFYIEEEGKGIGKDGKEKKANPEDVTKFRQLLTSLADLYVNDAFGCCHRGHSSMSGVNVPLRAAGLLVKKELEYFDKVLANPQRPYVAILGGAKVSDKIQVIDSLLDRVDQMVIAGGMCFTFRKVIDNMQIGKSIFDEKGSKNVQNLMEKAKAKGVKIILPVDFVCADETPQKPKIVTYSLKQGIPDGWKGLDIGPESIAEIQKVIKTAQTIMWNGPPGVFEMEEFSKGTRAVLEAIAEATTRGAITIVGGGDSASACSKYGYDEKVSHVSTGGGASLELIEGKPLPGVTHITDL